MRAIEEAGSIAACAQAQNKRGVGGVYLRGIPAGKAPPGGSIHKPCRKSNTVSLLSAAVYHNLPQPCSCHEKEMRVTPSGDIVSEPP